ncbi:septum formation family protein [Streptomyces abyssomicinicus]|uniref:septum formation family protein n=1 Tax=Streptomyces abyssomicinicus TaxID=574929 RepID=UPI001250AD92|nr:septum formation family protein [Streptomyces abyssomicinicus]
MTGDPIPSSPDTTPSSPDPGTSPRPAAKRWRRRYLTGGAVALLLGGAGAVALVQGGGPQDGKAAAPAEWQLLRYGGCLAEPGFPGYDRREYVYADTGPEFTEVPCEQAHEAEVFGGLDVEPGPYPGEARLTRTAPRVCLESLATYAMDPWELPGDVTYAYFYPLEDDWRAGTRSVVCLFRPDQGADPLRGSLRRTADAFDIDQLAYLGEAGELSTALNLVPAGHPEEDLAGNTEWAADVARELEEMAALLDSRGWPADAAPSARSLAGEVERAAEAWRELSRAEDAETFSTRWEDASNRLGTGTPSVYPLRERLGLTTERPQVNGGSITQPEAL